jgi:BirA family biotin operon repressor/biotin-[acetyl-CoA-carboxylase] ligase
MYFFFIYATHSTQDHSKALSALHSNDVSFWVQSQRQAQGRGQRGRKWESISGNLFLTCCFPRRKNFSPGQLSISIGVSLAEILKLFLPKQHVELKWPNDVLLNHKKCGGVLIEADDNIYIGIGVNITSHPDNTQMPATHLQAYEPIDINSLIIKIIDAIPNFEGLENFERMRHQWWSFAKNSLPYWGLREPVNGTICGIDEYGQLLIQSENGELTKRHQTFCE